jgi:hypothetical protein
MTGGALWSRTPSTVMARVTRGSQIRRVCNNFIIMPGRLSSGLTRG